ncbi:MAG: electron transport complex subunit E [Candidatus Glassbacteria bacterium]|nr:electron transport complex subunit E [Candidatus Glassbacteria bacterium]
MSAWKVFIRGLWEEVPLFRLLLGLCPALAVTTSLVNGLGMGLATLFVLLGSNLVVSIFRKAIPGKIRIPAFIVIIASFVTVVDLLMHGYTPELHRALGIFIPLIVVNCIILGRSEAFASRNGIGHSILDALGMGIGFTIALMVLGGVREILGSGALGGIPVTPEGFRPVLLFILPPGGFIAYGLLLAGFNMIERYRRSD